MQLHKTVKDEKIKNHLDVPFSWVPQIGISVAAPLMESLIYGQDDDIAACN